MHVRTRRTGDIERESLLSLFWTIIIARGKAIGVIFIDFRKAFDSVGHDILFYKGSGHDKCTVTGPTLCRRRGYVK